MESGTWCRCSEITCAGSKTYVQPVEEQFSGAAVVRRSNSKRFPPTSAPHLEGLGLGRDCAEAIPVPYARKAASDENKLLRAGLTPVSIPGRSAHVPPSGYVRE